MLNLDTHILIHAMVGTLTRKESELLRSNQWSISAIVLWEIGKLAQLGRIEADLEDREVQRYLNQIYTWPISLDVVRAIPDLDFSSDPADELIAATSVVHDVPLLTRDKVIRRSKKVPMVR